jgi:hypothetical protein
MYHTYIYQKFFLLHYNLSRVLRLRTDHKENTASQQFLYFYSDVFTVLLSSTGHGADHMIHREHILLLHLLERVYGAVT